jgi:hypothetical protein
MTMGGPAEADAAAELEDADPTDAADEDALGLLLDGDFFLVLALDAALRVDVCCSTSTTS